MPVLLMLTMTTSPTVCTTCYLQIWDVTKLKRTRTMLGHRQRVGTQAWNSHMLSSGSRDKSILLRDVRVPEPFVEKLSGHRSEVCGLKVGSRARLVLVLQLALAHVKSLPVQLTEPQWQ